MDTDMTEAFSAGCDARLAGLPLEANPHAEASVYSHDLRRAWERGYRDCELNWGRGVRGRWAYRKLPPVRDSVGATP